MGVIKTFNEFIEESIWSDIQKRSTGEIERKEDDVNLLDCEGLFNYIKTHYVLKNENRVRLGKSKDSIYIEITRKTIGTFVDTNDVKFDFDDAPTHKICVNLCPEYFSKDLSAKINDRYFTN